MPTGFDQQISEFSLEIHPWIFLKHLLNHLWRHLIEAQAKQFEPGAEMHQCYFVCQASCDSCRRVKYIAFQARSARSGDLALDWGAHNFVVSQTRGWTFLELFRNWSEGLIFETRTNRAK